MVGLLVMVACSQGASDQSTALRKEDPIRLTRTENGYEAELQFRPERAVISLRLTPRTASDPTPLTMSRRIELWRPLLDQALRQFRRDGDYLLTVGEYPELSDRIAAAVACSGKWDGRNGRPVAGPANAMLKDVASETMFGELTQLVGPFGYRVSLESAESVMLCPWRSFGDHVKAGCASFDPDARVPCGATLLFRMSRTG